MECNKGKIKIDHRFGSRAAYTAIALMLIFICQAVSSGALQKEKNSVRQDIPIGIITYNRIRDLDATLDSLRATTSAPVIIFQDARENPDKIRYLTTNEQIVLTEKEFPDENPLWLEKVGVVPNKKSVRGIKGQFRVDIADRHQGSVNNSLRAIKTLFDEFKTDMVFLIQDDVILRDGWYEKMTALGKSNSGWGTISGCSSGCKWDLPDGLYAIPRDIPTRSIHGQLFLVNKAFCDLRGIFKWQMSMTNSDGYINMRCRQAGLKTMLLRPPVAQHIGIESECWKKDLDTETMVEQTIDWGGHHQ